MKKVLLLFLLAAEAQAASAQQLPNGTFDADWVNCYPWEKGNYSSTAKGKQPEGWCVSNVPNVKMIITVTTPILGEEDTGASGTGKSVKLTNQSASGNSLPAYITLGTTWATAETKMTNVQNADGGVFGGIAFTYHPDALRLTYKCDRSKGEENMSVVAYLWKGTWTQTNVPSNTAPGTMSFGTAVKVTMEDRIQNILGKNHLTGDEPTHSDDAVLIASVEYYSKASVDEWTTQEFPFEYKSSSTPEKLNIVISANGIFDDRSTIKSGNSVTFDDVELVYWHALSALSYEGATIAFDEGTTSYDLSSVEYDEAKLSYTIKGQAATVTKSYNAETNVLTLRVEGEDIASNATSFTEYTIQFKAHTANPEVVSTKTYSEDLYVTIAGQTIDKQVANVLVETLDNGNINFVLKNFVLGEGETAIPVGNIGVNDIEVASDGSFTFNGSIAIAAGDDPAISADEWGGPGITAMCGGSVPVQLSGQFINDNKVVVYIFIDIASVVGYPVDVHLGYSYAAMAVDAEAQYGTFCAPFTVAVPSEVQAYTVASADASGLLTLVEVTKVIPANTPVVLFAENGLEKTDFFGLEEEGSSVAGMLAGVYENTPAPVGSYVLQNLSGKVGFYQVTAGNQPTIGANRCYLTVASGIKVFFFNEDDATSIQAIDNGQQTTEGTIYNVAGQRINKMQRGINIINGKKILK